MTGTKISAFRLQIQSQIKLFTVPTASKCIPLNSYANSPHLKMFHMQLHLCHVMHKHFVDLVVSVET